jgi:chemotaxis protein MotA
MDIATIIGLISGTVFLILGILFAKGSLLLFWDPPSVMITIGGSIAAMLVAFPMVKVLKIWDYVKIALFTQKYNPGELIITLVSFSEKARREGLLALEDDLDELDDEFLRKGIQLVVDGTDPELVRRIMETELENMMTRHDGNKRMFDEWSSYAPAFGMIGTLMGLILMLVNLEDRAMIGPYMAVALITTLYGAILANLVLLPISTKLDLRTGEEVLLKSIMIEGVLSIQSGDNPRIVKDKLVSFLPPAEREAISQEVGE